MSQSRQLAAIMFTDIVGYQEQKTRELNPISAGARWIRGMAYQQKKTVRAINQRLSFGA